MSVTAPPRPRLRRRTSSNGAAAAQREDARPRTHRVPLALWACVAVAFVNAIAWAFITPTFYVPDEPVHVGYAQYVGETGKVPIPVLPYYHPSADADLAFNLSGWKLAGPPSWSPAADHDLKLRLSQGNLSRVSVDGAGYASNNPPLYYYLEALPYRIAYSGTFLDRMYAMRILSALLAALTTGLVFMFVRELFPKTRWAPTLGALAVGLQPVFGFIGGGVNNDNLLWVFGAGFLWAVARAFRRGLTPWLGVAIGGTVAAGFLTKTSMLGFVPAALLALALLAWRAPREERGRALRSVGTALVALVAPVALWLGINAYVLNHGTSTSGGLASASRASIAGQLSYLWQFWLPRLPSQSRFLQEAPYPAWDTYFQGFVGRFGWFAFGFPMWVNWLALGVAGSLVGLAGAAVVRGRAALRTRWAEALVYVVAFGGLAVLVNIAGYRYLMKTGTTFEQTRYLFPALALYGAFVVLAVRGAGRRWAPVVAVLLTVLLVGQSIFAHLIGIAHWYS